MHTCTANEKSYVGQTTQGVGKRWKEHVRHSRLTKCADFRYPFARAIRKHGPEAFESRVLSVAQTKEELDNLERIWIILLQTRKLNGYNLTAGGEGGFGHVVSDASKAAMSMAKRGNLFCVGRECSSITRAKMSETIKGRILPPEWRAKIAAAGLWQKAFRRNQSQNRCRKYRQNILGRYTRENERRSQKAYSLCWAEIFSRNNSKNICVSKSPPSSRAGEIIWRAR